MESVKFVLVIFVLVIFTSGCKKSNQFTITGKITHADEQMIYLEKLLLSGTKPIDSVKINRKGEFRFKGIASIPTFYLLRIPENRFITLLVDSLDKAHIEADYLNFDREYSVTGSKGSIQVKELIMTLNETRHKLDSLERLYNIFKDNPDSAEKKAQWEKEYQKVVNNQVEYSKKFVMDNPFSMASVYALYQKFNDKDQQYIISEFQPMKVAASALNSVYPSSEFVKQLYANALQWLKTEQNAKLQQFIKEHGENSPNISLPDPYGKEVSLLSFRGKYTLLHFWAGASDGSRVINSVLCELYNKYKNKGFEIYQVSLDTDRTAWVNAIDDDKLIWTNVSDLKGCNQAVMAYNIKTLPYNYLLDKEGSVIAQNLKGPELNKLLSEILK